MRIWEHVAFKGHRIKWFNATIQHICTDIIVGTKTPHHSYRPVHQTFGDDTFKDMSEKSHMKKKFKKLLKYKLCDKSEDYKLIKTLER